MPATRIDVDHNFDELARDLREAVDAVEGAERQTVRQLSVLAEGAMKQHAPEGSGTDVHMRDTIRTSFDSSGPGFSATVKPHKTTRSGIPLVDIVTSEPVWTRENLPWGDNPIPLTPLRAWTGAKWGDPSWGAAVRLAIHLVEDGATTFPNPFVDESIQDWESQVEDIAGEQVRDALSGLGGI